MFDTKSFSFLFGLIAGVLLTLVLSRPAQRTEDSFPLFETASSNPQSHATRGWKSIAVYRGDAGGQPFINETLKEEIGNRKWFSQAGQDRTIADVFSGFARDGFFVDLAANDPVVISNTLALERELGWNGLCIEANPVYQDRFLKRGCQLVRAAVAHSDNEIVTFSMSGWFGGIIPDKGEPTPLQTGTKISLRAASLATLLKAMNAPKIIGYLSLDIEGAEWPVMSSFPWDEYTFYAITVERPPKELKEALVENGYKYMCLHGWFGDEFWVHRSHPRFEEVVAKYGSGREGDMEDCNKRRGDGKIYTQDKAPSD